jgi:pimeloyl-ACP methyl ester carboxylesterase
VHAGQGGTARTEQMVRVGEIELCVSYRPGGSGEPLLCIAGLGMQLAAWPTGFLDELEARGFLVITYDQRDVGRSTYFDQCGPPDLLAALRRDGSRLAYRLEDLAADAVGLLATLGIDRAHLLGVSMGAMVGQLVALRHREVVRSLCSAMGSTGDRSVGQASPAALQVLLRPPAASEEDAIAQRLRQLEVVRGRALSGDAEREGEWAREVYRRANHPVGAARQLAALLAAADRTGELGHLELPVLVVHGSADEMIDPSGGRATAEAIPGSRLMMVEGMGHDLPAEHWGSIADAIAENAGLGATGA